MEVNGQFQAPLRFTPAGKKTPPKHSMAGNSTLEWLNGQSDVSAFRQSK